MPRLELGTLEHGRMAIQRELGTRSRRLSVFSPGGAFIPAEIADLFPNAPSGGAWDPAGATVGGNPVWIPTTGIPGTVAPFAVPAPGQTFTVTSPVFPGTGNCVGFTFDLSLIVDICLATAPIVGAGTFVFTIATQDGGSVVVTSRLDKLGIPDGLNGGSQWTLGSSTITGGSHAADWTAATNCKGNSETILTPPTAQLVSCPANRGVWRNRVLSAAFQTGGGAPASMVGCSVQFQGTQPWAFGRHVLNLA